MSSLLELPAETLIDILRELPGDDILRCKQICKTIQGLIDNDIRLQYQIRLAVNGMVDNPSCSLPTSERFERLVAYEDAWKSPRLKDPYELNLGGDGAWEFSCNVLAQAKDDRTILFVQLPSSIQQTPEKRWEISDIGFKIDDFSMDPDQDLLVVGESQPAAKYVLHVSTLTGDKHPLACDTGLLNWATEIEMQHPNLRIAGDYVGVGFDSPDIDLPSELVVWNWKTGQIHLALRGPHLSVYSFLTLDRIIVLEMNDGVYFRPTGLRIVSFSTPALEFKDIDEASYDCCFGLPEVEDDEDDGTPLEYIQLRSEPSPFASSRINPTTPFRVDTDKRIFALTFVLMDSISISDDDHQNTTLLISGERLTERLKSIQAEEGRRILWDDWGLTDCSIFVNIEGYDDSWVCNVYGTRLINRSLPDSGPYVLDCNKFACQRASTLPVDGDAWSLREKEEARDGGWFSRELSDASLPVLQHKSLPMNTITRYEAAILNEQNIVIIVDSQSPTTQYCVASLY
ncbi:hypothetical protein QCA50_005827 [Cerrena zonata]|uniref:F-box domain-containing protein n=1 Tax=Cerrena zonata TaxID=2478898 RepID=A0AAW0GAY7_9APHY